MENTTALSKASETIRQVKRMLGVGTPLLAIDSHDHPHVRSRLMEMIANSKNQQRPVIEWNVAKGFDALNERGQTVLADLDRESVKAAKMGPHAALAVALKFPEGTVLVMDNLHWFWDKPAVMQAIQDVREPFKSNNRAMIALTLDATIPSDLVQSISYAEDPLPDEDTLAATVTSIYKSALGEDATLDDSEALELARELRGTSPFRAEQLAAQSLTRAGIDRSKLRDNARKQINDTAGLSVEQGSETFDSVGGLQAMRDFLERYFSGPRRPDVVVRIEEIEKAMSGYDTDTSGTSGDILGTLLTAMEDYRWTGILAYGVSGCGKSLIAKSAANQFGAKAIRFDPNECKGSLVGETGKQIRAACNVLRAIGGERVFFIASMNRIQSLPLELRRRFSAGTWYFDVPDTQGREEIWKINAKAFGIEWDGYDADMLTGSDIRDIMQRAYELSCTPTEAAKYHVPLCKASPNAISESRQDAQDRYLDANAGGPYREPSQREAASGRKFEFADA